ncbi:MAG: hypothetical protein ACRYFS_24700 [Janthinobacterium lividum]
MKRSRTRPPRADNIREVLEDLRRLSPTTANHYHAAEAARLVYDKAQRLYLRFPQDSEASNAYFKVQKRYWQLIDEAYPPTFQQDLARLAEGDLSGMGSIIAFLEADPIFDSTGYLKEDLSRLLCKVGLPTNYIQRLQRVVLSIVDRRDGREFRAFCRLARKADGMELREGLTWRLANDDPNIRRRARWVLEALAQKDSMEKHA